LSSAAKARGAAYDPRHLPLFFVEVSRVELGARPYVDASACRRLGDLVEGRGRAFLFLEAAAVYICVLDKMPRWGYTPQSTQAAWHTVSLPSIAFAVRRPAVPESLWAPRPEQTPPHQPTPASTRLRYISILRRLLDVSCGGGRAGATALGFAAAWRLSPLFPCLAF